jgi:hypothetical protein
MLFANGEANNQSGRNGMLHEISQAGSFTLPGSSLTVNRMATEPCNLQGETVTSWCGVHLEMSMERSLFCERPWRAV